MENKKYYLKPTSLISSMYKIYSIIILIIAIIFWFKVRGINPEVDIILNVFLPIAIAFLFVAVIFYWFIFDRFHYFKLTNNMMIFYKVIPSFMLDYQKIKSVKVSKDTLINIDYEYPFGVTFPNKVPWKYKVYEMEEFLKDFSQKYKMNTGKNLKIIQE